MRHLFTEKIRVLGLNPDCSISYFLALGGGVLPLEPVETRETERGFSSGPILPTLLPLSALGQRNLPLAHQGVLEGHDCLGVDSREGQGG